MTARDWLAKRAELETAVTNGPWETREAPPGSGSHDVYSTSWPGTVAVLGRGVSDAEWIADARTSAPTMRKALEAVLELHHRRPWEAFKDFMHFGQTEFPDQCDHCRLPYPCMTVAAVTGALEPTP